MTTFANAVIINHEVFHRSDVHGNVLTRAALNEMGRYYSGEDRHAGKDVDKEPTQEDLHLESLKERDEISRMIDYYSREGQHEGRNPEHPMQPGETSGAAWDAHGLADFEEAKERIWASGSNLVRTVVTVPREWAPVLHLTSKAEWQALVRSTWPEFMDAWGIIPKVYQSYCAWMHTDNEVNMHVHVLSWDSSGHFFTDGKRIPHDRIDSSKEVVRKAIYKDFALERSIEKNYVREAALYQAKALLGCETRPEALGKVKELARQAGSGPFAPASKAIGEDGDSLLKLLERAASAMPESGFGRTGYNSVSLEARAAANLAVMDLKKIPCMAELSEKWDILVERGADMLGKHGWARDEYISREMKDLDHRLANAFLRKASELNQPWLRSSVLAAEKAALIRACAQTVPSYVASKGAGELLEKGAIEQKTALWGGYRAIDDDAVKDKVEAYCLSVVEYAQNTGKDGRLKLGQAARIADRARFDLAASLSGAVRHQSYRHAMSEQSWKDERLMKNAVSAARIPGVEPRHAKATLSADAVKSHNSDLDILKHSMKIHGRVDFQALSRISETLMATPEVRASIARASTLSFSHENDRKAMIASIENRREAIERCCVDRMAKEIVFDDRIRTSERAITLNGLVQAALQRRSQDSLVSSTLANGRKKMHHRKHLDLSQEPMKGRKFYSY